MALHPAKKINIENKATVITKKTNALTATNLFEFSILSFLPSFILL